MTSAAVNPWEALRALRERELVAATIEDEPINGADAVDELVAIREQLDAALANAPDVGAVFEELSAALRAHDDAQWDYAGAPECTDESDEARASCEQARVRLNAALDAVRSLVGAAP